MDIVNHFTYHDKEYTLGTKVRFTWDFIQRQREKGHCLYGDFRYLCDITYKLARPSIFSYIENINGKTIWKFYNCEVEDFVPDRDIEEMVFPVYYTPPKTDKEKIQEKKHRGETWSYIWPGTLVYIFCMLIVIPIFNERVWGWIAATIIYYNYYYEQITR